jgi:hypothetical protein
VAGDQWVAFEIAGLQSLQPIADEGADAVNTQMIVQRGVFFEIGVGKFEEGGGGAEAVFLQVNKGAGELDQAFVEGVIRAAALGEPEFFQDIVRFKIKAAVEAFEITEVVGVEFPPLELLDYCCDGAAFFAHVAERIENVRELAGKINRQ